MSSRVEQVENEDDDNDNDNDEDDTQFISTCHSVRFDTPVSHICNCVYHITPSTPFRSQSSSSPKSKSKSKSQSKSQSKLQSKSKPMTIKRKPINCLAVAGRDGFIRVFESDAPFSCLFAFPIRYERVLSLEFLPKTSSFISVEHTADGSGNHVVIYEDWNKFPNLLKNVQVVEKGEDIIFNFVSSRGLPQNGYIGITAPGNMRLKSFQVEGINGESSFTFDVKIRTIQMSYDGTIISSNTIFNAPDNDPNKLQYISHLDINDDEISASLRRSTKPTRKSDTTTLLLFELRTHKNIYLGPGAYRLSFPVAWKSRSRQRFRRELFAIELCDENGLIIEAAQQLWIIDSDTATAAAQGYTTHPKYGGKINVCAENIRSLRKPGYIEQMKIFELGERRNNNKNNNTQNDESIYNDNEDDDGYTSQSWFPSDLSTTGSDLNESISCMNICKKSGRIVTCSKSLISIYDCDLLLRTYKIPHHKYIDQINDISSLIKDDISKPKVSKYRLGATTSIKKPKKKKITQMITIRTPPLKILSLHASFMVRLLYIDNNFLAFASDSETRMVHLNIKSYHHNNNNDNNSNNVIIDNSINIDLDDDITDDNKKEIKKPLIEDYSSGEDDDKIIIDIYNNQKSKPKIKEVNEINEINEIKEMKEIDEIDENTQIVELSDIGDGDSSDTNSNTSSTNSISTMRNVCVVFDDKGCPSIKHHAASFMLIPSIYEFNRYIQTNTKNKLNVKRELGRQYPFEMIGDFSDHAHRIDLSTQTVEDQNFIHFPTTSTSTSLAKKLNGNVVILNVTQSNNINNNNNNNNNDYKQFDINNLDYNVIEKEILDRSQAMFDINQIAMIIHRRFVSSVRIRALQVVGTNNDNDKHPNKFLVATDEDVFVYDLRKRKLSYSLNFQSLVIETYLHNTFLFVLTEKDINVYSSEPTETGQLLLLWSHPLLRMRGLKILNQNKFCLEFGSQTEMDRFSVNADGRRIRSHPFDLRMRIQSPDDPDKRPLTIFEESSPKNILLFEWSPTSEMVLSLITKSHECMTQKIFKRSRHLLVIALELIKIRKSYIYPLYKSVKNSKQYRKQYNQKQEIRQEKKEEFEQETVKKSLTNLISSAWNWMNTNPISSMVVGNSSSLSNSTNIIPKKSVIQSEWQMLKQLKKECHGLLADVYIMENKYDIAAQHYILSNRQFIQIRQLFNQHINKKQNNKQPINGLTLFYRLFLEHKSRIDHESSSYTWNCIMEHFKTYKSYQFSTIFLHPFMLNTKFNLKTAVEWLDECIINETSINNDQLNPFHSDQKNNIINNNDPYVLICPSTVISTNNIKIIQATHYLAKVVLLCLKNDIDAAQNTLSLIEPSQFILLLQSHKRLWLEWTHSKTFRRLCCITFPWEFAKIVLEFCISCYQQNQKELKTISLSNIGQNDDDDKSDNDNNDDNDDHHTLKNISSKIEELFPLRRLNFNESMQYFEYQSGGPSLMQCYLEGAVRYLVEQIDEFESIMIESNRCLPESDHALYMKYLAELEEIGFELIELYVQYLQKVCYDDTTNILMGNLNIDDNSTQIQNEEEQLLTDNNDNNQIDKPLPTKRAIFERKRHIWNSQYPVILRPIPSWLTQLLQKVQSELFSSIIDDNKDNKQNEIDQSQNEQMIVMTRICTLLSCIEFGSSITKREKGAFLSKYRDNKHINFKNKDKIISDNNNNNNNINNNISLQWKRRLDLLLAPCPDIPHKYINAITIIGYVSCGCISDAIHIVLQREQSIITEFALSYCKSISDWRILLQQILKLISISDKQKNDKQLEYLQKSCRKIWRHLGRLSSLSTKQSEWLSVMDLISLVPDDGNLEFFAPIFSDLCRNQAGDSLNMELFDRIVQIEKDKDYGFNQQMHEIFFPQSHQ